MDSLQDQLSNYYDEAPYVKKPTVVQDMAQRFEEASIGADLRDDPDFKDDFKSKGSSYEEVWSEGEEEAIYLDENYDEPTASEKYRK